MTARQGLPAFRLSRPLRRLLANPGAALSAVILVTFVFVGIFAPILTPHDPFRQNLRNALMPPSTQTTLDRSGEVQPPHYLGTDKVGRDLLSRILYGARVSLLAGVVAVGISAVIGTILGLLAGYFKGWLDSLIMLLTDIQLAFPTILLAIAIIAALGSGLTNTIIVLIITSWPQYARIIRAETLSLREREYVQASVAIGASSARTIVRHVFPQVISALLVLSTFDVGRLIILEAALSFLGLGVQPPLSSWGNQIADGRDLIWTHWWMVFFPGLALSLVIFSTNLFGDWLRDTLDPRLRY
jgi:peptide/nickel transport system permease protein